MNSDIQTPIKQSPKMMLRTNEDKIHWYALSILSRGVESNLEFELKNACKGSGFVRLSAN